MVLSASAVGAADVVDNQDVSTSSQTDMLGVSSQEISNSNSTFGGYENNAEVLSADASNNELLGADDGTAGSYDDLAELIKLSSGTLTLQSDYEYKGGSDAKSITVSKSLIIDGNNHTINGKGAAGGFDVTADNVVVQNLNIANFSSANKGAAVYWTGHYGNLINVSIRNAVVTAGAYAESGGISWWGNDGTIRGVSITNCTSKGSGRHGAALSCAGANLKIFDSVIYNVTSGGSAYAGVAVLGSSSNVLFDNCVFNQIATGSYGMFFYEATSGLKFMKCNFSSTIGKIIFCRGSDVAYTDCNFYCNNNVFSYEALQYATFKNCTFNSFSDISTSVAITNENCVMKDNYYLNCTFINCGKIYKPYVKSVDSYINSTFINCTNIFSQYSKPTSGYLIMENCTFINSTSASYDSVIAIMGGIKNTLIGNCFINSTTSSDICIYSGSAAYYDGNKRNNGNAVILDNSSISVNLYSELYVTESGSGTVGSKTNPCNLTFALNNIAKDGIVHIANGTYNLYGSLFNVNFIMDNDKNVTLINGTLDVKNGYHIRHLSFSNLTTYVTIGFASSISNCTFIHNKVTPIYLSYTSKLYNCTFDDCNCSTLITHHTHGINSLDVELVTIIRCNFTQFVLTSEGGANAIFQNISVSNSTIGYIFVLSGTGVYLDLNDIKFSGVHIKNCNMTNRVFSYSTSYIRSLIYEHITVEDCNYIPYAHVFLVDTNTVLRDVTVVNLNNTRKDIALVFSLKKGSCVEGVKLVNFDSTVNLFYAVSKFLNISNITLVNVNASTCFVSYDDMAYSNFNFTNTRFSSGVITTLYNNNVLESCSFTDYTGHIMVDGIGVRVTNTSFTGGNNSDLNGSAMEIVNGNYITFQNCNFTGNNATCGAVYFHNGVLRPGFIECNFTNNLATECAGALYFKYNDGEGTVVTFGGITRDTINWDIPTNRSNGIYGNLTNAATVVYVINDTTGYSGTHDARTRDNPGLFDTAYGIAGKNCEFYFVRNGDVFNYTGTSKEGIALPSLDSGWVFHGNNTYIENLCFIVDKDKGDMEVYNITYLNTRKGSVVTVNEENVLFENCTFENNGGDNVEFGAAIQILANNTSLIKCNFINNSASNDTNGYGGALFLNASNINITYCIFDSNSAYSTGSHICLEPDLYNIIIENNKFTNAHLSGTGQGSSVTIQGYNVDVKNNSFSNNTGRTGAALSVIGDVTNIEIINNTFFNNTAFVGDTYYDGGAFYLAFANELKYNVIITNNTFENNTAANGGAWFIDTIDINNALNIGGNNFIMNNATNGGAIYSNCENITLPNYIFKNNNATNGGAVYINQTNNIIRNCDFIANNAVLGGGLYVAANGTRVIDTNFINNTALSSNSYGSAIYIDNSTDLTLNRVILDNNDVYGQDGVYRRGDISFEGIAPSIIDNTLILKDTNYLQYISNRSSAIYYDVVYVNMTGTGFGYTVDSATTMENALRGIRENGVIYICDEIYNLNKESLELLTSSNLTNVTIVGLSNKVTIKRNTSMEGNDAKYMIVLDNSSVNFKNIKLDNVGIDVLENSTLNFDNVTYTGVVSPYGGIRYHDSSEGNLNNSNFTNNEVSDDYLIMIYGAVDINGSYFNFNRQAMSTIYYNNENATIKNSVFNNNTGIMNNRFRNIYAEDISNVSNIINNSFDTYLSLYIPLKYVDSELHGLNITYGGDFELSLGINPGINWIVEGASISVDVNKTSINTLNLTFDEKGNFSYIIPGNSFKAGLYNITIHNSDKYNNTYALINPILKNGTSFPMRINKALTEVAIAISNKTYNDIVDFAVSVNNKDTAANVSKNNKVNLTVYKDDGTIILPTRAYAISDLSNYKLNGLAAGSYWINVTYAGNENFTNSSSKINFFVYKAATDINVTINNVTFNDTVNVQFKVNNSNPKTAIIPNYENVTVTLYDENYNPVTTYMDMTIGVNKGNFNLSGLKAGNYSLNITFAGNENFTGNSTLIKFTVFKARTNVTVKVNDSTFNQTVVVAYELANINNTNAHIPDAKVIVTVTDMNAGRIVYYNESVDFANEKGVLSIDNYMFAAGDYNMNIAYGGNENFTGNSTSVRFTVFKARTNVTVKVNDSTFNQTVVVAYELANINNTNAHIPDGKVIVSIINRNTGRTIYYNDSVAFANEKGVLSINNYMFAAADYTLNVTYTGNENFTGNSTLVNFTVSKARTNITVKVNDSTFNQTVVVAYELANINNTNAHIPDDRITVTVTDRNTGNVVYYKSNAAFNDEKGVLSIINHMFAAGNYTVNVTYAGSENFTGNSTLVNFTVSKARSNITVTVNNTTFNQVIVIGYVLANVNNTNAHIPNGNVIISIINKNTGGIVYYNSTASFTKERGTFRITDYDLAAGDYTVNVTYAGNDNFTGNSTKFDFTVVKARTSVSVSADNVTFNDTVVVEFTVNNINNTNARIPTTDKVIITVYDSSNRPVAGYNAVNTVIGDGKFNVSGLKAGKYSVKVNYTGNENFTGNSSVFNFTVFKAQTNVSITANDVTFNNNVTVEFSINNLNPDNAHIPTTDKVIITVYDSSNNPVPGYNNVNVIIGNGKFNVSGLKAGDYTVNITYNGNENFTGNSSKFAFKVFKARSNVTVKVNDSTFNQTVTVEYTIANANNTKATIQNGNLIINVVNKNTGWSVYYNSTATFTNGKGIFKISDYEFAAGNYTANIIYDGNENFTGNSSKFDFTVSKARTNITVKVNNTTFNQTVVIEYILNNNNKTNAHIPNANVIITVTDKNTGKTVYYNPNAEFVNEKGSIAINNPEFKAGNYSVNIAYKGNENFTGNNTIADFNVLKARTNVSVNVNNVTFDDNVIVNFNVNNINNTNAKVPAGENVIITVYDSSNNPVAGYSNVNVIIENGKFNIKGLKAGNYSVNITYNGNENFTGNSTKFKFSVNKARTNITAKVNNSTFNQPVIIEYVLANANNTSVHIPNGNVIINIINRNTGGSVYYNSTANFVNEKGAFKISDYEFAAGNYTLNISYNGNENFTGNSTLVNFTVFKAHSNVAVNVNNSIFNETVIVEYTLNTIGNVDAHIPDGTVVVSITNTDTGRRVYYNATAGFTNEKGILIINNYEFAPGNYSVNVTYNGNANVEGNSTKSNFVVSKARSNITVKVNESTFNQTVAIEYILNNIDTNVHIPNGKVNINIISKETYQSIYNSTASFTNEKGVFKITDYEFAAGRYSVDVSYSGNDNFTASSTKFDFTVSKARTNVTAKVNNITFNQTVTVEYVLTNNNKTNAHIPDGNVTIKITNRDTGRTVYYNNSVAFANEKGNLIINTELGAGNYTLNVVYNGNKNFTGNSTLVNFTIFKARTNISGTVNNVTFNNPVVVEFNVNNINNTNAVVPYSESVTVTVYDSSNNPVRGYEDINVLIGDAKFSIDNLAAGNYSVNVTYLGDANFIGSSSKFQFTVLKASTNISVDVNDVTYNQTVSMDFTVNNLNKNGAHVPDSDVSINITNKNTGKSVYYKANVAFVNEKGSLTIDDYEFAAGNYTVKVTYNGNDNFTANSTLFDFTVSKARTNVSATVTNVTYNNSVILPFTVNNINNTNARIPDTDKVIITVYDASNKPVAGYNAVNVNIIAGQFEITGLKAGNYTVNITYNGNENFTGNSSKLNFTVFKAHTNITANVNSTTFNQTVIVEFVLDNTDNNAVITKGNVIVDIINKDTGNIVYHNATVTFNNEKGALIINNYEFGAGNYIANVNFTGNENFTGNSTSSNFVVSKARTNVTVNVNNITFNQSAVVEFKLNNINNTNANIPNGKVIIDIISDETHGSVYYNPNVAFTSESGAFTINDYVFDNGNYTVNVIYEGNENFTGNSSKFTFSVSKTHTNITGKVNNVTFNDSIIIEYELNNINTDANIPDGKVWINVTNKNTGDIVYTRYSIPFNNQKGVISIDNYVFEVGNYTVTVTYDGEGNFIGNSSKFDFTVYKAHTSVFVNVENVIFNKTVVVNYNLTNLDTAAIIPDGVVTFNIISKDTGAVIYHNDSIPFTNQKGSFLVNHDFDAGNYTINVTYNGNNNLIGNSSKSDFTVFKAHTSLTTNVNNSIFNNTVAVKYTLYNIDTAANIPDGNVNIVIINKQTGSTVYNNVASFNNQKGILYINDFEFDVGNYTVTVTYDGEDNFVGNSTEFNFTVSKAQTAVYVNVNDITYNQSPIVEFELSNADTTAIIPNGKVTVNVTDKKYGSIIYTNNNVPFNNEKGTLTISDCVFNAGEYSVNVFYEGNDKFIASSMIANFKVFKATTSIIANVSNVIFNETVTLNFDVINSNNTDAAIDKNIEKVEINVVGDNGYRYSKIVPISNANIAFNNLGAGNYEVTVKYAGDDNFLASEDKVLSFAVLPANTTSSAVVNNVTYDNRVSFRGNVSNKNTTAVISDTDKITIKVINNETRTVYSADISVGDLRNGYTLPLLDAGNYTLNVHYNGCQNFTESVSVFDFNIARANSIIKFNDDYVVIGNNLTFDVVNITDGRSISLKVNGRTYEGTVIGGVGYILIDDAQSGTFNNVLVIFDGDTNYNPSNCSNTVKFIRPDSFAALQLLIDNNTNGSLAIDKDYTFDPNTDDATGIILNKTMDITGNNHTINANNSARIFNITADDISINNISLINANASDNGGAILWSGNNGNIDNVNFINNSAVNGGAVSVEGDDLTMGNVVFVNNSAVNGGAVSVTGDDLTMGNVVFVNNSAVNGDAINMDGVDNIDISDSMFVGDSISINNTEDVSISNVSFQDNDISDNSIISITDAKNTNIVGVNFTNNDLSDSASLINIDNSNTTHIYDTSFTGNNAGTHSNIINIINSNDTNIDNSTFNDNSIADNGSIISILNSDGTIVNSSSFNHNNISNSNAIFIGSDDIILNNSEFNNNNLINSNILYIIDSDNINVTNSDFTNNILTNSSVTDIIESSNVTLRNDKFIVNTGDENSTVINIIDSPDIIIDDAVISNNTVSADNNIVNIKNSAVDISDSILANNVADDGTVISIDSDSEVYVNNIAKYNNTNNYKHRDILYETSVVINSNDIHVGDMAIVNASIITSCPYPITGIIMIRTNDDNYYFTLTDNKGSFSIAGLKEGIYNITAIYNGNEYIDETLSNTVMINVSRIDDYNFTINNTEITTSESLIMNLPSDASGNVTVTIGNESFIIPVVDGKAVIDGEKLPLDSNTINASYSGDDKYVPKELSDIIKVKCDNYDIIIENKDLIYGDDLIIDLPAGTSGNVTVTIGNETFILPINNGKVVVPADNLPIGFNNITANFTGDDKYTPNVLSDVVSVRFDNYTLNIDSDVIVHGDDLVVVLPSDASGNVSVTIGNDTVVVPVVDGKATISTDNIPNGNYSVNISYSGDDKYVPQDDVVNISVVSGIVITAPEVVKYYGGPERFIVNIADIKGKAIAGKTVTITLNGVNYTRVTNEYGNVSLPLNLPSGEYTVLINVDDESYNSSVIINPTIIGNDLVKVYKNDSQYYVTVYGFDGNYLAPGSIVTFNINGVFYTRSVGENGRVKLNINLPQGTYIITANNTVTGEVCANNVTVISRIVDNHDLVKYFRNDSQYYVTLLDDNGNPVGAGVDVIFNINGVFYTRHTNASGVAKLNINLPEGEYIITAEYNGCLVSNKIVVLPTLTANDVVKKYGERGQFIANVVDNHGNPYANQSVTFNINGVFYNRVSDINGQAKLNINLPVGEYIITSSYNGASIANKVTVTN